MDRKFEVLSRVGAHLVSKSVTITDSTGWQQAHNEQVIETEVVDNGIICYFGDENNSSQSFVKYEVGRGQHIKIQKPVH